MHLSPSPYYDNLEFSVMYLDVLSMLRDGEVDLQNAYLAEMC